MAIFMVAVILTALVTPLEGQWIDYRTPGIPRTADGKPNLTAPAPRTADGKPDLTGLWEWLSPDTASGNVLLRKPGDLQPADIQPWVQALLQQRAENFGIDNPRYQCLPDGPNYSTEQGFKRILQTPAMIAILQEDLTHRQIHMDGRALETDPNPSWMGYSVGRWEGDTLVVETNGFNDRTWLIQGYPHTEALRMTERFRRTDFGHLEIAVTFDDPKAYNKPWTLPVSARLAADTEILEAVCNERLDSGQQHWIGRASDARKSAVTVAPEVLGKYVVGVYTGIYLRKPAHGRGHALWRHAVHIRERRAQAPCLPQSETNFPGTGLTYQFLRNDRGIATDLVEGQVAGEFKFKRQN
jgi:hypothetical protein